MHRFVIANIFLPFQDQYDLLHPNCVLSMMKSRGSSKSRVIHKMALHGRLIAHTGCISALETAEGGLLSSRHTLLSILQTQIVQFQQASMNS